MEKQSNYKAYQIVRFNEERFVKKIQIGTKIGTFRQDRSNMYAVNKYLAFYLINNKDANACAKFIGTAIVREILNIEISSLGDYLLISSPAVVHIVSQSAVLDSIALADGFNSWNEMVEYLGNGFKGKWILFDMDTMNFNKNEYFTNNCVRN